MRHFIYILLFLTASLTKAQAIGVEYKVIKDYGTKTTIICDETQYLLLTDSIIFWQNFRYKVMDIYCDKRSCIWYSESILFEILINGPELMIWLLPPKKYSGSPDLAILKYKVFVQRRLIKD